MKRKRSPEPDDAERKVKSKTSHEAETKNIGIVPRKSVFVRIFFLESNVGHSVIHRQQDDCTLKIRYLPAKDKQTPHVIGICATGVDKEFTYMTVRAQVGEHANESNWWAPIKNEFFLDLHADLVTAWMEEIKEDDRGRAMTLTLTMAPSIGKHALSNDAMQLWTSGDLCDFTVKCADGEVKAHKAFLAARSSFFRTLFTSDMADSKSESTCEISQDLPTDMVREAMEYVYTGSCSTLHGPLTLRPISQLFTVADRWMLSTLSADLRSKICAEMTVDDVLTWVQLADQVNDDSLMAHCIDYVCERPPRQLAKLIGHSDWDKLGDNASQKLNSALVKRSLVSMLEKS